ncbi:hypothetical protein O181_006078 [Austropuccinia psidii MF-1]|uniref:Uncharacterized protein n=1 Tax=Austropuccinia psidii MF-1 TaxID=1389203 RepID=A0A9Q3BJS5_9BASI|nr:hypothetical protein [Austropuccinia psidii MF-1]
MAQLTPILQHFQDVLTGKFPFDQIPKSQDDQEYSKDPLECGNIHGRPKGANRNMKIKEISQYFKSLKVNPTEEEDPIKSDQHKKFKITVYFPPPQTTQMASFKDSEASLSKLMNSSYSLLSESQPVTQNQRTSMKSKIP